MLSFLESFPLLESLEILAAALVATGCAGELALIFLKAPSDEDKSKLWEKKKHFLERIFVAMVAIGVTAELLLLPFDLKEAAKLHESVAKLRSENLELFAVGEKAKKSAAEAIEASEKAKAERASVELQVETFRSNNLTLQSKVLMLENKTLPRTITLVQRDILMKMLHPISNDEIEFMYATANLEQKEYAEKLAAILQSTGFKLKISASWFLAVNMQSPMGITCEVQNVNKPPANAVVIQNAFKAAGVPCDWVSGGSSQTSLRILVGTKPPIP